ncbi:hypothetical protein GCM10023216_22170 [Isoptericola chiayiensis]|uniref:Uncharacterized protein n=1 Tax=Isoptericola chiayiensis TaxID=579446 RepID=A0ABP8YJB5_9MICO
MIVRVTTGRPPRTVAPKAVRTLRAAFDDSATQSTHCTPTAAGRWHSGQAGRPQRWHRTYDTRSGCRGHTGGALPGCWAGSGVLMARPSVGSGRVSPRR